MSDARRAGPEDAREVLRLRQVMIDSMTPRTGPGGTAWQSASLPVVRAHLADRSGAASAFAAFVVDRPGRPGGLAALAVGTLEYRIGGPLDPTGRAGHVFSVATDPDMRRRGYARTCVEALLGWFREQDAGHVDLNASAEGEPLYASLGFVRKPDPAMRLRLRG
jgi:GNAT superfamily N-acetyltransferase